METSKNLVDKEELSPEIIFENILMCINLGCVMQSHTSKTFANNSFHTRTSQPIAKVTYNKLQSDRM